MKLCELTAEKGAELLQPSVCTTIFSIFCFFTYPEDGITQTLLPSSAEPQPVLPNSHEEFGRPEEHTLYNCKAWSESSRDVSVLGLGNRGTVGFEKWGVLVTWWKWGVSCLTARKTSKLITLIKLLLAALSLAYSCFQFLTLSHEIYVTCPHIPCLNSTLEPYFLEIKICISLGTYHVNTTQTKSNFIGSGAFVGRWCR